MKSLPKRGRIRRPKKLALVHVGRASKIDPKSNVDLTTRLLPRLHATRLIREISDSGDIVYTKHAKERLLERNMETIDVTNVLRCGGIRREPRVEGDSYCYRIQTDKMFVVVRFLNERSLRIVTAGRIEHHEL